MMTDKAKYRSLAWMVLFGLAAMPPLSAAAAADGRNPPPPAFVQGSWTLALVPDTQGYVDGAPGADHHDLLDSQMQWLADNAGKYNIKYVIGMGDMTEHNTDAEWRLVRSAYNKLDGKVPYAVVAGNHDLGIGAEHDGHTRQSLINTYFPVSRMRRQPTFGGVWEDDPLNAIYNNGRIRINNNYQTFEAGGHKWLILGLEFGPRDAAVAWANQVVAAHPDYNIILDTHAYLFVGAAKYEPYSKAHYKGLPYGVPQRYDTRLPYAQRWSPYSYPLPDKKHINDGRQLWDKLVKKYPNFRFVVCGHVMTDGQGGGHLADTGDSGNMVQQVLTDVQDMSNGGDGYLRLLRFLPGGTTVQVLTYSPSLNQYLTDSGNQFKLTMTAPVPRIRNDSAAGVGHGGAAETRTAEP